MSTQKYKMSKALDYLRRQFREEKLELLRRQKEGAVDARALRHSLDWITFFEKRLEVAKLIEKEEAAK